MSGLISVFAKVELVSSKWKNIRVSGLLQRSQVTNRPIEPSTFCRVFPEVSSVLRSPQVLM